MTTASKKKHMRYEESMKEKQNSCEGKHMRENSCKRKAVEKETWGVPEAEEKGIGSL